MKAGITTHPSDPPGDHLMVVATVEEWQELANGVWNCVDDPERGVIGAFLKELERLGILP